MQKWHVPESSNGSLTNKPHLDIRIRVLRLARSHLAGSASTSFTESRKSGNHEK